MRLWTRLYGTGLNVSANVIQPSNKYTIVLSGTPRAAEPNGNGENRTHGHLSLRGRLRPGSGGW